MSLPRWLTGLIAHQPLSRRLLSGRTAGARKPRRRPPLCLESLEDRLTPSTFTVTNTGDTGAGSLRQAILDADADPASSSSLAFAAGLTGTITLESALPDLSHNVTINGPGANVLTVERDPAAATDFSIFVVDVGVNATIIGLTVSKGAGTNLGGFTEGGGIFNQGTLRVQDDVITGNTASDAGGIANFSQSGTPSLTVVDSTISNNTSSEGDGGAGIDSTGTLSISNSTISGNQVTASSGGGVAIGGGSAMIANSTIADNTGSGGRAGGLQVYAGSSSLVPVNLFDTIIAGNSGSSDVQGPVISQGHNLIGNGDGSSGLANGTNGDQVGTTASPIDARLGALGNNGGPTPTIPLLGGSPALDAGDNTNAPATDQRGFTRIVNGTIDIGAYEVQPIGLSPPALPGGTDGTAYSQTITATEAGYQGAFTFALSPGGNLPPGLTLAAGGALSGTPTAVGTFSFTVMAVDSFGFTGSRAYSVTVSQPTITLHPTSLPAGIDGTAYSQTITATETGFQGAFTFALAAGSLPAGLTLAAGGALSGTLAAAGTFSFTVTATDSSGFTGSQAYNLTVAPVINLHPTTLPAGMSGTAYSQTITATEAGYQGAFTFALSAGNLPPGLTLAAGGALSGTPAATGMFSFTVTATDSSGFAGSQAYSVTVAPAPAAVSTQAGASAGGVVGTAVLSDTATLTGGATPTGIITFTLTQPDGSTVKEGTITVTGDGTYTAPAVTTTEVGTYTWHASYSGDANNSPAADDGTNESVVTVKASPTIVMQADGTGSEVGSVLSNTATLSGGFSVNGGTITFTLTAPDGTSTTETVTVNNGDGAYSTPTGITATQQGTYTWMVTYSGNATNNPAADKEVVGVAGPPGILLQASDATYTITVTNDGAGDAQDVTLTDPVPAGATFVSAAQTAGPSFTLSTPAAGGTGTVQASAATLPAGESAVFQVVLLAGPTTVSITNTATITSMTSQPGTAPSASASGGFVAAANGLQVRTASWLTKFAVPVQLALSPTTVADGSPPGTLVGIVTVTTDLIGQFQPAVYSLPAGAANNGSFALTASGGQGFLAIQVPASSATQATYQVLVQVDIGVGPQTQTFLVTVVNGGEHVTAQLVSMRVGKKKKPRLMVEEFDAVTMAFLREFQSPFQAPAFKGIEVSVRPGAPDQIVLTARKAGRTVTRTAFA